MPTSPSSPRTTFTFDRVVRIFFTVCVIVVGVLLLDVLKGVVLPFAVACLIAYILEPVVKWNMRMTHAKKRFIPVVITLLETTIGLTAIIMLVLPYVVSEASQMTNLLRRYATIQIDIPYISGHVHQFLRENIDFNEISKLLTREQWIDLIKKTLSSGWQVFSSGLALLLGALSWLIVVLYVVFIMLDYDRIRGSIRKIFPPRHREIGMMIVHDIEKAMNRYFRGQMLIATLVGVLFAIGFFIIGLPMAIVFGLFVGVLNLVPYLQIISIPVALILCLVDTASSGVSFWTIFLQTMIVYVIVQVIQDLILTPRIMGKSMGLNPAIILLSLSVWGTLLGFMGMIIALPLTTLLISYYGKYISNSAEL